MDPTTSALIDLLGDDSRVLTQPQVVERLSRDFYWYSPVLASNSMAKSAMWSCSRSTRTRSRASLRYCHAHDLPVTARGAGTGNYGQAVPLQRRRRARSRAHGPDRSDSARRRRRLPARRSPRRPRNRSAQDRAGSCAAIPPPSSRPRSADFSAAARAASARSRTAACATSTPSAPSKSSPWSRSRDCLLHEGEAVHDILHAWGTNGIITRIWLALTPAVEWSQCAVAFDSFDAAFDFSERIATDPPGPSAWSPPSSGRFPPSSLRCEQYAPEGKALIFFLIASEQLAALEAPQPRAAGGTKSPTRAAYPGLRTIAACSPTTPGTTPRSGRMKIRSGLHLSAVRIRPRYSARADAARSEAALRRAKFSFTWSS